MDLISPNPLGVRVNECRGQRLKVRDQSQMAGWFGHTASAPDVELGPSRFPAGARA